MASATVAGRSAVATGKRTVSNPATAVVVNTAPGGAGHSQSGAGYHSLHDCATPGQAGLHNCVWPINMASADGITYTNGIVIHTVNGDSVGNFTITYI